jgi:fermentation-respiration switch protein FrsA (DUF1100 family)
MNKKRAIGGAVFASIFFFILIIWIVGGSLAAPDNHPVGNPPGDLSAESVQFLSESGSLIHGWLIPGKKQSGAVVLMHGVRADRTSMLDRARLLSHEGYTVLLFDFQAHGESPGSQITFGYLESRDARAAVNFIRARAPGERVGLIGVSMGGAAALLATPPLAADAMVIEMVYPTIDRAIDDRLESRFGKVGRALGPLLSWQLKPRLGIRAADLRPIDRVSNLHVPKLFIAGANDEYTKVEESRAIDAAAAEPKELWIINGAKHEDLFRFAGKEYERRVVQFFDRYLRNENVSSTSLPAEVP